MSDEKIIKDKTEEANNEEKQEKSHDGIAVGICLGVCIGMSIGQFIFNSIPYWHVYGLVSRSVLRHSV